MEEQWYIHDRGTTYGPVTTGAASAWLSLGRLTGSAVARTAAEGDEWRPIAAVLGPGGSAQNVDTEHYQRVAETIGLVPDMKKKHNLVQGIFVGVGSLLGLTAGAAYGAHRGSRYDIIIWALLGLVLGMGPCTLVTGLVLMVMGLKRR